MSHNRQGSNASQGGKGSGIVGFQRVTTGKDHIPSASDISVSTQIQEREEEPSYGPAFAAVQARKRGQEELEARTFFFSQLQPSTPLAGREVDLLNDACDSSIPDMVNVGSGKRAVEYARRDPEFGTQMREVYFDSLTGGLRPGVEERNCTYASSELGMFHEMYLIQKDNPEWKPLYDTTCAMFQYVNSRVSTYTGGGLKLRYPNDGSYLHLDTEAKRLGVKFPSASTKVPVEMRLNDALAEGWYGPNAG